MSSKRTPKPTKSVNLTDFLDNDLGNYAFYKVLTQIPHLTDGLTITQRKIMYVLTTKIPDKKVKTAQMYSYLLNETNYVHGDMSVYNTTENMAATYKNNINLIEPFANFGTRTIQGASSPRYTELKLAKISKEIFPKEDFAILQDQEFEGQLIEPYFLAPIIPLAIINGNNGIAMGYSSDIMARNPLEVITIIKKILTGKLKKLPVNMKPWIPFFKGTIENGENSKQWIFKGVINKKGKRGSTGTIEILEVPFYSREKYLDKVINKLLDDGVIKSWNDNCKKNDFYFELKVPLEIYNKSEDELLNIFKLISTNTETLTFIKRDESNIELLEYNNIAEYFKDWIAERLNLYNVRKNYIISRMIFEINKLENRIRFIDLIIKEKLEVRGRKKKEIEKDLENLKFDKIEDSFDYLLGMPIWNLTQEKIDEFVSKKEAIEKDLEEYRKTELTQLWLNDLVNLEKMIKKELQEKTK